MNGDLLASFTLDLDLDTAPPTVLSDDDVYMTFTVVTEGPAAGQGGTFIAPHRVRHNLKVGDPDEDVLLVLLAASIT